MIKLYADRYANRTYADRQTYLLWGRATYALKLTHINECATKFLFKIICTYLSKAHTFR